jgi:hypothetical protein
MTCLLLGPLPGTWTQRHSHDATSYQSYKWGPDDWDMEIKPIAVWHGTLWNWNFKDFDQDVMQKFIIYKKINTYLLTYVRTYLLTPWCRILFERAIVTQLVKNYRALYMESEGSLSCSQKPTTGPYPEPGESSSPPWSISPSGPA